MMIKEKVYYEPAYTRPLKIPKNLHRAPPLFLCSGAVYFNDVLALHTYIYTDIIYGAEFRVQHARQPFFYFFVFSIRLWLAFRFSYIKTFDKCTVLFANIHTTRQFNISSALIKGAATVFSFFFALWLVIMPFFSSHENCITEQSKMR